MEKKTYFTHDMTHDFMDNLVFEYINGKSFPCFNCEELTRFYEDCGTDSACCSVECKNEFGSPEQMKRMGISVEIEEEEEK